ncbi:hypothetical protein E8E14_007199 [Neopestalotiopsis sp. 37M]|nr:hypothetical protein E8E14_007199 [Neopestalotiopsis sp. 37M]
MCDEEVAEIEEEDRELICLLDDLVNDFVAELRTCGDTFQRFLIRYWAPRMEDGLADLKAAKPSPEQMFAAEQAGVIWESSSESEEEEEYYYPPSPTLSERFDLFMEQMDEIVVATTQTDST